MYVNLINFNMKEAVYSGVTDSIPGNKNDSIIETREQHILTPFLLLSIFPE